MASSKAGAEPGDDAQLHKDVKAQLAALGLGIGGGDAAFDDFAPGKARQRIGQDGKKGQAQGKKPRQQDGRGGAAAATGGKQAGGAQNGRDQQRRDGPEKGQPRQRDQQQQQQQRGKQQPWQNGGQQQQQRGPQRRPWAGGDDGDAPAAPKVPNARSILPKDEPTIWHEAAGTLPKLAPATAEAEPDVVARRRVQAERLLLVEEQAFEQNMGRRSSADAKWLQQVRRSGTTADKVAAMSVLIQDGAVANLPSLDGLLAMCGKRGGARSVVSSAMDALKELFTSVLLPDRKLRFFEQQPLDKVESGREGERRLLYWLLEDGIKKRYAQYVEALEGCSRDNLPFLKDRAVKTLYELLSAKPEGEARLLSVLVNKLGDPDRKLASKVGYLLTRLLAEHPGMNVPVVREVERFMFRPGLLDRARYYAVVYLNQMVLSHKQAAQAAQGGSLAKRLIDLYFTLFKMILDGKIGTAAQLAKAQADKAAEAASRRKKGEAAKKRAADAARQAAEEEAAAAGQGQSGEMDGRMLSALITGVRRAFPYVPPEEVEPLVESHADALFRLVHARSFGVATQALLLLFQLMSSRSTASDRFYRALYSVLGSPELFRSTKAPLFLSLLFKALKADVSARRTAAFAKRLLQLAQEAPPHFACGCLLLTSELLKARPSLWGAVLQPEETEEDALEHFEDAPDAEAAAQRAQQAQQGARQDAAAEDGEASPESEEEAEEEADSEEEEEGEDGEEDSDEGADLMPGLQAQQQAQRQQTAQQAQQAQQQQQQQAARGRQWPSSKAAYDMHKREPQYSNADRSCLWELTSLAAHVHPSVAAMSRTLLAGQNVSYSGDPLRDLTLGAFLEKFVAKKAKAAPKGDSAMQPLAAQQATVTAAAPHQWAALAGAHAQALAVLAEKDVRPDDMFFHKFYSLQAVRDKAASKKKKKKGGDEDEDELLSDAGSEDSEAADDFLAGEEEGGEGGIGADPDRGGLDYDYAELAAAMDSGSDSDDLGSPGAGGSSGSEEEEGEEEEEEAVSSGSDGLSEEEEDADGRLGGSDEDEEEEGSEEEDEELAGATFSDMSGSEEEEDAEEGGGSEGEEEEEEEGDSSDGEFEAALAAGDLSGGESDDEGSSSEEDDAAADAEVAELMRRHNIQPLTAGVGAGQDSEEEGLNPFELPEAGTSSEEEWEAEEQGGGRQARGGGAQPAAAGRQREQQREKQQKQQQKGKRKKSDDPMSVFASADDYAEMIEQDLAGGAGLDGGSDEEGAGRHGQRRHGGGGKRQRGAGGGRGGARPQQRMQQPKRRRQ